jgi:hypothetical protein
MKGSNRDVSTIIFCCLSCACPIVFLLVQTILPSVKVARTLFFNKITYWFHSCDFMKIPITFVILEI